MLNITLSGGYTSESGELKPIHDVHNPSEKRLLDILGLLREGYGFYPWIKEITIIPGLNN